MLSNGLWLTRNALAEWLGIDPDTVTRYVNTSRAKVDAGNALGDKDFPLPDMYVGRTPVWYVTTIERYAAATGRTIKRPES